MAQLGWASGEVALVVGVADGVGDRLSVEVLVLDGFRPGDRDGLAFADSVGCTAEAVGLGPARSALGEGMAVGCSEGLCVGCGVETMPT